MIIIGIGEYGISTNSSEKLITYSLGSCVAVIMYCRRLSVAAMAHIVLPTRPVNNVIHNQKKDAYYANEAIPLMMNQLTKKYGCKISEITVDIFGGAISRNKKDLFRIGFRNSEKIIYEIISRKLKIRSIDVGGNMSRTVSVNIHNGCIDVRKQKMIM